MVKIWTMKSCEKCEFFHCFLKPPPIGQNLNYKILLKICIFSLFFKSSPYWSKFELWNLAKNLHFFSIFLKAPPIGQNLHFAIIHLHTTLCKVIEIEQNFSVKFWKNSGYRIAAFWSHIEFAQSQIYSKNPQNCHFLIRSYWHSSKLKNSKIETGTVWKFQNLSTIQISFVLNFCECLVSIFAISNILGTKYLNFGKFQLSKICTISSKSFFTSFKIIKLVIF